MYINEGDLELAFLESGRPRATLWHSNNPIENDWIMHELLPTELVAEAHNLRLKKDPTMAKLDALIANEPGLVDAFFATAITEDGITYYPKGVGRTFNPKDNRPDDDDPYNLFTRRWSSQEWQHGVAESRAMEILGLDMVELERQRRTFISNGSIPEVNSSFDGAAYTALQESLTAKPYQKMISILKTFFDRGVDRTSQVGAILDAVINVYRKIAQDERMHRKFISDTVSDGLHSGNESIAGRMITAIATRFLPNKFTMPGSEMPGFRRRALNMARANIFTSRDVLEAKKDLLKTWRVGEIAVINADGYEAQRQLGMLVLEAA